MKKIITICALLLVGCAGFEPLSTQSNNYSVAINAITFGDKPNKAAMIFKNTLRDVFALDNLDRKHRYILTASVDKSSISYGTQQDSINTRAILKLNCQYTLTEKNSGSVIAKGRAVVADSYEISTSLYSSVVTEEAVSERLAYTLAHELKNIIDSKIIKQLSESERGAVQ